MGIRVLLAGAAPEVETYAERARAIGMDPVCAVAPVDRETLLRLVRDPGVRGICVLSAEVREDAEAVAETLGLPGGVNLRGDVWGALREAGAGMAESRVARDDIGAEAIARELGEPLWVKPASPRAEPFCMTVQHLDDLPLALANVRKRAPDDAFLLQRPVEGDCFWLAGFRVGRAFHAVEAVSERVHDERFRVPIELAAPCRAPAAAYQAMIDVGHRVAQCLPAGWYPLETHFVLREGRLLLTDVCAPPGFEPALVELLRHAFAIDLRAAYLRVAAGESPDTASRRYLGAAVRWIPAASGVVQRVRGVETARAMPEVGEVRLAAAPGDTLGHVVDRAARDRTGYVLATGGSATLALARVQEAVSHVHIETKRAW
jgi:biotin carboxylase